MLCSAPGASYFYKQAPIRDSKDLDGAGYSFGFFSRKLKFSCVILASALLSIIYSNQQLQVSPPETIGEIQAKPSRFMIFPFTHYGPNNQLLGLRQALSFCRILDVLCIEPGFSDHFMHHAYRLGDFYNISDLHLVPRSSLSSPHKPDVFVYGETNKGPRWPGKSYFLMHNISYQQEPSQEDQDNYAKIGKSCNISCNLKKR